MEERKAGPVAVASWVSYDIANTVFWVGVVGLAFPLWLTNDRGGDDAMFGYTMSATMAVVLVASPFCGSYSDQTGRRIPLLLTTTLLCIAVTLLIDTGGTLMSLGLFALALCAMELGTVFYNSLLTEVSTLANRGFVAGMGVGIGYLGSFLAVGTALLVSDRWGYVAVFRIVAVLFLLFALPIFLFLREQAGDVRPATVLERAGEAWRQLSSNLRSMGRFPGLRTYLLARFLFGIGISTATGFAVIYASDTIGLTDQEIQVVLVAGISVAIPCGLLWGRLVDRIGASTVLVSGLVGWVALLLIALAIPVLSWTTDLWWAVGILTGLSVSCVFAADRPMIMSFSPPEYVGEFFGLHGMVGKLARVIGYFMWAVISVTLGFGQPAAVVSLVVCLVLACLLLTRLATRAPALAAEPAE